MRDDLPEVAKRIKNNADLYLFLVTLREAERPPAYAALSGMLKFNIKSFGYVMKKGNQLYGNLTDKG